MAVVDGHGPANLNVQRVALTASALGATQLVAAVTGQKIVVVGLVISANGAVNFKFQSAANDITGLSYANAAGWSRVLDPAEFGWFATNAGEALNINLSAAVAVGGSLLYVLE